MATMGPFLPLTAFAAALALAGCGGAGGGDTRPPASSPPATDTTTTEIERSAVQGLKVWSPDGTRFIINKEDAEGTAQIYIGTAGSATLTCITDVERPGGPTKRRFKMQPHWHPSGSWIFLAVEREVYDPGLLGISRDLVEGQLQCGIWTNMWAVTPDGVTWVRLTDFQSGVPGVADGFTGPAISPDGRTAVWSQIIDGNIFAYFPFGRWQLIRADLDLTTGQPRFTNQRDITPTGMHWNEPGNFHPDNRRVLITGSTAADAQGMDQYTLDTTTGALVNLTNSPTVWDEHGVFSPDGRRIIFMSAYPYRDDPNASKIASIKAEFMLMNADGGGLVQITRFMEPGQIGYSSGHGIAANAEWAPDGKSASATQLFFPDYAFWDIRFDVPAPRAPDGPG